MSVTPDSRMLSLRVSVTNRCSLRCAYCAPEDGATRAAEKDLLSFEAITGLVRFLKERFGLAEVRLTGGEPLLRPRIEKLVAMLRDEGVTGLALTTSGQQLAAQAGALKRGGLDRVNVSLDSLHPNRFAELSGGGKLDRTLAGIEAALSTGLRPVKLNVVVLRGRNDAEAAELVRFGAARGCQVRFLELMPIGVAGAAFKDRFMSSADLIERLRREFVLTPLPVDPRSTSRNYSASDSSGCKATVGFISPVSEPFCVACPRLRLTAGGTLIGCLARPDGVGLAPLLRDGTDLDVKAITAAVERMLGMKRRDGAFLQPRAMVGIGG